MKNLSKGFMKNVNRRIINISYFLLAIGMLWHLVACSTPKVMSREPQGAGRTTLTRIENDSNKWTMSLSPQQELQWKKIKVLIRESNFADNREEVHIDPPSKYYSIDEIKGKDLASSALFSDKGKLLAPYYCLPENQEKVINFFQELIQSR